MSKMTRSESGKIGGLKSKETSVRLKKERIEKYNKNPKKCLRCDSIIPYHKKRQKLCSQKCNGVHNHGERQKIKCPVCKNDFKPTKNGVIYCSLKCHRLFKWIEKKKEIKKGLCNQSRTLKKYLIERDGHKCSICNLTEWRGQSIGIILDHIDGHSENNMPSNLRLVCGNCDMQLPTYKGKNKGNGRHARRKRYAAGKSY